MNDPLTVDNYFTEISDTSGKILFKEIPIDTYTISIEESYSH
jgi:hypothetical protein